MMQYEWHLSQKSYKQQWSSQRFVTHDEHSFFRTHEIKNYDNKQSISCIHILSAQICSVSKINCFLGNGHERKNRRTKKNSYLIKLARKLTIKMSNHINRFVSPIYSVDQNVVKRFVNWNIIERHTSEKECRAIMIRAHDHLIIFRKLKKATVKISIKHPIWLAILSLLYMRFTFGSAALRLWKRFQLLNE